MSKRFGRQQKRRARQRIEMLEKELHACREHGARNQQVVRDIARVLGSDLIVFEPPEINGGDGLRFRDRIQWISRVCQSLPHQIGPAEVPTDTIRQVVNEIDVLRMRGVTVDTSRAVHVRVAYGPRSYGYAVRPEALAYHGLEYVVERMAAELRDLIIYECLKEGVQ